MKYISEFECFKGMADNENVIIVRGDTVAVVEVNVGEVVVKGTSGWCDGVELIFSPKQFIEHFATVLKNFP
jgi:hypothetical protein